jgi:hypothetical protein
MRIPVVVGSRGFRGGECHCRNSDLKRRITFFKGNGSLWVRISDPIPAGPQDQIVGLRCGHGLRTGSVSALVISGISTGFL